MGQRLKVLWLGFFALNSFIVLWLNTQLPNTVATHFDGRGQPNGWMSKMFFLIFSLGISAFLNGLLLILYFTLHKFPENMINIPKKDYWFSNPERKAEALARLRTVLVATGIFVNLVSLVTHHIVSQENGGWVSFRAPVNAWVGFIFTLSVVFLMMTLKLVRPPVDAQRGNRK